MIDKDLKYAQNQVKSQNIRVLNLATRVDKLTNQQKMWEEAIRSIKEQKAEHLKLLNSVKDEYKRELKDLQRMQKHCKALESQKNMLHNQHLSVGEE